MFKNNQQAALPVNTYEQYNVVLNRDSFLKTSKKLYKHIREQNKQEFTLSEIQEMLSKALGNRNWRELDEKFKNFISTKDSSQTRDGDNVDLNISKEEKSSKTLFKTTMNFKNVLNALNSTEITKFLTITVEDSSFTEPSRQLAHIVSLILCQKDNIAKLDLAEISSLVSFEVILKLFQEIVNGKSDTVVTVTNREQDEEDLFVVLDNETKRAVFKYVQKIPNFEYLTDDCYTFHKNTSKKIIESLNCVFLLNEDFTIYKTEWAIKERESYLESSKKLQKNGHEKADTDHNWSNNSWLYAISSIAKKVNLQRNQKNWKYSYNQDGDIMLSDIFVLYAKNVIEDKNRLLKDNLTNILNNLQTYKDLSLNAQIEYE